jgi:reactive chlorine resistance protein C
MSTDTIRNDPEEVMSAAPVDSYRTADEQLSLGFRVESIGRELARCGLVAVLGWIGFMKFTAYEADGISAFVANSPLMSWAYEVISVRGFSAMLGIVEVAIAILIAARPFSPRASALGGALAVGMFLTTLSFVVTTPGVWEPSAGGFPALSAIPGQFLIKDVALLGVSLWIFGESLKTALSPSNKE